MKIQLSSLAMFLLMTIASCNDTNEPEPDLDATSTIVYQNDLSTRDETWRIDSSAYIVRKFSSGHYAITEDSVDRGTYTLAPCDPINAPYSVQVDGIIQLDKNKPNAIGYIGFIFNYTDVNHYSILEINNDEGTFFIFNNNNGSITSIAPNTACPSFKKGAGQKNTLKISQSADKVQVRVNGVVAAKFKSTMPSGDIQVGLFVGTLNIRVPSTDMNFSPTTGLFNNFIVSNN